MKTSIRRRLAAGKRRIEKRLDKANCEGCGGPMLRAANIQYELAERTHGMTYGGIGSMLLLVRKLGLADAIDRRLRLLKMHQVESLTYNWPSTVPRKHVRFKNGRTGALGCERVICGRRLALSAGAAPPGDGA